MSTPPPEFIHDDNLSTESIVLGLLLFNFGAIRSHLGRLSADLFYRPYHRTLARIVLEDIAEHGSPDYNTIGARAVEAGGLPANGVGELLRGLIDFAVFEGPERIDRAITRLEEVHQNERLRELISQTARDLEEGRLTPGEAIERIQKDSDSIQPLKGAIAAESNFDPIPASQLIACASIPWIWDGYLAPDHITLLIGLWKAGKTTLLAYFLAATAKGGQVGQAVSPVNVLVITEESPGLWAGRRDRLGIADNVSFIVRPFKGRPSQSEWQRFLRRIAAKVKADGITLVIFDTFASFSPCEDENNSAQMMAALTPLHLLTAEGAAVLLVHHPRKGDGSEFTSSRGSGALTGFVDIIVELRRFKPDDISDRRRVLKGVGRFDETPADLVIELTDQGYQAVGTKADAGRRDHLAVIEEILTSKWEGLSAEDVREQWPEDGPARPGRTKMQSLLAEGHAAGRFERLGAGVKGDEFRYRVRSEFDSAAVHPLRDESNSNGQGVLARITPDGGTIMPGPGDDWGTLP